MSLLDKLLGRKPAEAEAPPDDSWMSEEQRNAKLAWWESRWMDRIVTVLALLLKTLAISAALGLLALLGWTLYSTPVPPLAGPISADMTRAASFGMIPIVLGVPVGLAVLYFVGRFLFNVIVAICKDPIHKVYKPLITPLVSLALLAALAFFHQPVYATIESVYFKVVQTHRLAKTEMLTTKPIPAAPTPSTAP